MSLLDTACAGKVGQCDTRGCFLSGLGSVLPVLYYPIGCLSCRCSIAAAVAAGAKRELR